MNADNDGVDRLKPSAVVNAEADKSIISASICLWIVSIFDIKYFPTSLAKVGACRLGGNSSPMRLIKQAFTSTKQLSLITAVILDKLSVKRLSCLVHKIVDSIALNFEDSQVGVKFRQSPSSFSFPLLSLGLSDFVCVPWN